MGYPPCAYWGLLDSHCELITISSLPHQSN
nr:MAG TPA: hypothetical protein [Caudoviricetes sp.]